MRLDVQVQAGKGQAGQRADDRQQPGPLGRQHPQRLAKQQFHPQPLVTARDQPVRQRLPGRGRSQFRYFPRIEGQEQPGDAGRAQVGPKTGIAVGRAAQGSGLPDVQAVHAPAGRVATRCRPGSGSGFVGRCRARVDRWCRRRHRQDFKQGDLLVPVVLLRLHQPQGGLIAGVATLLQDGRLVPGQGQAQGVLPHRFGRGLQSPLGIAQISRRGVEQGKRLRGPGPGLGTGTGQVQAAAADLGQGNAAGAVFAGEHPAQRQFHPQGHANGVFGRIP